MRFIFERARWRVLVMAVALLSGTVLVTSSAGAAENDDFAAVTTNGACGVAQFIDYGPGNPGGGNNDDYVVIHDYCADGHGVRAYLEMNNSGYWWHEYNGNGRAGDAVIWEPYPNWDVKPHQTVTLEVCLVDGQLDPHEGSRCGYASHKSADG